MSKFSHINDEGKANMVYVGDKPNQKRMAKASGFIALQPDTIRLINDNQMKKGDVLTVAEIAGIQAAKSTSGLIPLCHQVALTKVTVNCRVKVDGIEITSEAYCNGQTGVEMEALTAVSVALLTIYDMCKAVDKSMIMGDVKLIEKTKQ